MKSVRSTSVIILLLTLILSWSATAHAYSTTLFMESRLVTPTGTAFPDGTAGPFTYNGTFKIYNAQTGGVLLWTETQPGVTVSSGKIAVLLGKVVPLPGTVLFPDVPTAALRASVFASESRWIEISLTPAAGGTATVFPRKKINTSAYAANADRLDGLDSTQFSLKVHTHTATQVTGVLTDAQIPSSITRDSEVLDRVKAVDGEGSGVDSDLLDGKHASQFSPTSHSHIFSDLSDLIADAQIPSSITRDSKVMTIVKANDGTLSGVDADLLDGLHAGAFSRTTHTHTSSQISDIIPEPKIDPLIARDSELASGLSTKAPLVHDHNSLYYGKTEVYTKSEVDAIKQDLQNQISALQTTVSQLTTLLANVSRSGNEITFSGVNVNIVSGTGATDGWHNGLGNLIIGYNEKRSSGFNTRTGSHNLVVGKYNNFSSHGGLVVGHWNEILGQYASVSGGGRNVASGWGASVSGGEYNEANGFLASVSGGDSNVASGEHSSVTGGRYNMASGLFSSVSGGAGSLNTSTNILTYQQAFADFSSISGGLVNFAGVKGSTDHTLGRYSSVSGGSNNTASGEQSSISGGMGNTTSGYNSIVSGGAANRATGGYCSVSGGYNNTASEPYVSVSGGKDRWISDEYGWGAGGLWQDQ